MCVEINHQIKKFGFKYTDNKFRAHGIETYKIQVIVLKNGSFLKFYQENTDF